MRILTIQYTWCFSSSFCAELIGSFFLYQIDKKCLSNYTPPPQICQISGHFSPFLQNFILLFCKKYVYNILSSWDAKLRREMEHGAKLNIYQRIAQVSIGRFFLFCRNFTWNSLFILYNLLRQRMCWRSSVGRAHLS